MASTNANSYTQRFVPNQGNGNGIVLVSKITVATNPTANDTIKLFHENDLKGLRLVDFKIGATADMDTNGTPTLTVTLRSNDGSTPVDFVAASTILQGLTSLNGPGLGVAIGYKFDGTFWFELEWNATAATFAAATVYVVAIFVRDHN